jgi:hypothetical protein
VSVNRVLPHLLILPEDDAERQIAVGFHLEFPTRQIQVMPVAGGWGKALKLATEDYANHLRRYPEARLAVLIDMDGDPPSRLQRASEGVPEDIRERLFILGPAKEPEDLSRAGFGALEEIGRQLGRECRDGDTALWDDEQLRHNRGEADRLRAQMPAIFAT